MASAPKDITTISFQVFERAEAYYTAVQERLVRATRALESAGVPYAVVGGNAVMAWVVQADEAAIRPTRDVDLLMSHDTFEQARAALEPAGFLYRHSASLDMFLDGPNGKARDALHIVWAGRKVRETDPIETPQLSEVVRAPGQFMVVTLDALVRMKLTSYRHKDIVHLQDMISVGLVDSTWTQKYPPQLRERLEQVLANPEA